MCCLLASNEGYGKVIHHFIPLILEGFFEQHFDKISYSLIFIFPTMGGSWCRRGRSCKGSTNSSPNYFYPDLVGDMHTKNRERANCSNITDFYLWRNGMKYIFEKKHRYTAKTELQFCCSDYNHPPKFCLSLILEPPFQPSQPAYLALSSSQASVSFLHKGSLSITVDPFSS